MPVQQPRELRQLLNILLQGNNELKFNCLDVYFSGNFLNNLGQLMENPQFWDNILPRIKSFCKEITKYRIQLKNDYSVEFSPHFEYYPKNKSQPIKYPGLFLVLKDSQRKQVGVLRFSIGFPFIIDEVQGTRISSKALAIERRGGPELFFQKNKQHFEVPLIDSFIGLTSKHFDFQSDPKTPKIVFGARAFSDTRNIDLRRRIVERYCPRSQRKLILSGKASYVPRNLRIMEKHFSRLRRI